MELKNKKILIISPQAWGKMFLSKHHYAIELAKIGNQVYFLNPPDDSLVNITITPLEVYPNLWIVKHNVFFPINVKFHFIGLFHFLMKFHIKKLLKKINQPIDIIWSFDLGNYYPLDDFPATLKIFHPVDYPVNKAAIQSAKGCQIIFSIAEEYLPMYQNFIVPKYFINHGIANEFLNTEIIPYQKKNQFRVGYSGNLLRGDIDKQVLKKIILENPQIIFECWGSYESKQSNIGSTTSADTSSFIAFLKQQSNVMLHGVVSTSVLAKEMRRMDAFLICYDVQKDQSKGTNYHKVIEYISTGRVIISNNITTYKSQPDLVQMIEERTNNEQLPKLFSTVINSLEKFNSEALQQKRIKFAMENSYSCQIKKISNLIYNYNTSK